MLQDIPGSISLTADIWSSCAKQSYLGVTAYFIDSDWTMQHILLDVLPFGHPHTGEAIKEAIKDILEDFGITTKFLALVTDNAANMLRAFDLLEDMIKDDYERRIYHIRCSSHVLHLIVQEGFKTNSANSDQPLNKLRLCTSTIHRSPKFIDKLQKLCEHSKKMYHTPAMDLSTRWTSTYRIVDVALGQRKALDMLIANAGHGSVLKENSLSDEDWEDIISDHVQLKMFFVAFQVLVAENYPTLHLVHEIYVRLINKLESQVTDRNKAMVEKLRDYWGKLPTESGLAVILDLHLKPANSLHQTRTGKADSAKALRARSNLLRTHSGIYAEYNPRLFEASISPPTPKRQRSALDKFMNLIEGGLDDPMSGSANINAIDVGQEVDLYCAAQVAD